MCNEYFQVDYFLSSNFTNKCTCEAKVFHIITMADSVYFHEDRACLQGLTSMDNGKHKLEPALQELKR